MIDQETVLLVLAVLGGISEALSLIPAVKSNGIFQAVFRAVQVLRRGDLKR